MMVITMASLSGWPLHACHQPACVWLDLLTVTCACCQPPGLTSCPAIQADAMEHALMAALPLGPQSAAGGVSLPDSFHGELQVLKRASSLPMALTLHVNRQLLCSRCRLVFARVCLAA